MSSKTYILTTSDDQTLRKQIRGTIALREARVHKDRREKRTKNKDYRELQDWE